MILSIITINLNNAAGLQKTIKSIVSQTCPDFEYIVIDGGSTDGSVEIVKEFADKIDYWISEPDKGIYHAMNKGIGVAKGEFVQFLNSGDTIFAPDVIEKTLLKNTEFSIISGNMLKLFPNGKTYLDKGIQGNPTFFSFYRGTLNHSSSYIRRSLFDTYGFYDESLKIVSDWKWFLIAIGLNNEQVRYINETVSCFQMDGISNTDKQVLENERRKVLEELIPPGIRADYDAHGREIGKIVRINQYCITRWLFWFIDRILHKIEKYKNLKVSHL